MYIFIHIHIPFFIYYLHVTINRVAIFTIARLALAHHLRHVKNICCIFVVDVSLIFFFLFLLLHFSFPPFRSFACSAAIYRRRPAKGIIVCINIIPSIRTKTPRIRRLEASRSCLRARLIRPCCMNTPSSGSIDHSERARE